MTNTILKPDDISKSEEAKANPRAAMVRVEARKARGYSGQRKHDLRIGPQPAYVDGEQSGLNMIILAPPQPSVLRKICNERRGQRETQRAMRSDAAVAFIGIIGFGKEAQTLFRKLTPEQQKAAYLETAQAIAQKMGTTLEGLVSHGDETATHAHFTCPAYDMNGLPLTSTVKRGMLREIQTLTAEVMGRHCAGIERGKPRYARLDGGADYADTVHKSVKELHETLPADIEAKQAELGGLISDVAEAQARYDEMQGRVEKLTAKEELNAKEAKRLEVYQSRLDDRDAALKAAEARLAQDRAAFEGEKETALKDIELTKLASQAEARKERAVIANHARTVTAQLDADRAEYLAAAQAEIAEMALEGKELDAAAADLERRENDLAENAGFLKTAFNLLQRAVVVIRDQMKLPISKNLRDTLADIDALTTELSAQEDPGPDRPDI